MLLGHLLALVVLVVPVADLVALLLIGRMAFLLVLGIVLGLVVGVALKEKEEVFLPFYPGDFALPLPTTFSS